MIVMANVARRTFTTTEYHRMGDAGILTPTDRVELIEGEILRMSPIGRRHAGCVNRLTELFSRRLAGRVIVHVQNPVVLDQHSEPQPDVTLLRRRTDFYSDRHPKPEDVLLLVEVIDSSAGYDRALKLPLYARRGIAEVWLADLAHERIEVYRGPTLRAYRQRIDATRGQRLSPRAFPRTFFRVNEILGDATHRS
jgi:Uma2 family endonuclease